MLSQKDKTYLRRMSSQQNIDKDFIDNIVCMHLLIESIHRSPFLSVLVTREDEVYMLGIDRADDFGMKPVAENPPNLTKINELCGRKIHQFASGKNHILALSESGVVYAWGHNDSGQLGNNSMTRSSVPVIVAGDMENQVIQQIECGSGLSVALTEEGKVFTWGDNKFGRTGHGTDSGSTLSPKVVEGMLINQKIVKFTTNWVSVLCLSVDGKVLGFGFNGYSNLCYDRTEHLMIPVLAKIPNGHKIKDISSGMKHTLAMTETGILFAWGMNDYGQLTDGAGIQTRDAPIQIKLNSDDSNPQCIGKVSKILAEGDLSFAMDDIENVFVWGRIHGIPPGPSDPRSNDSRPTKFAIPFPELFNKLTTTSKGVINDLLNSFDKEATSDFVITIEGKKIHVHKAILQIRSPYFANMLSGDWKESGMGEVVIGDHYSYAVYYEFLRYLYCGELRGLAPDDYLQLAGLARMTLDDHLAEMCNMRIKRQLTHENLLKVFSAALVFEEEELSNYCSRWAVDKKCTKKIVGSGAYDEIPAEHVRKFFRKCSSNGAFELFDH